MLPRREFLKAGSAGALGLPAVPSVAGFLVDQVCGRLDAARAQHQNRRVESSNPIERDWRTWLTSLFPDTFQGDFAPFHDELWSWVWNLQVGIRPDPLVQIWSRKLAKSTMAESACCAVGALMKRSYGWYVSMTQEQADDHVANVGALLESAALAQHYPFLADKNVNKFGHSKGWRHNRLWTAGGYAIDSIGLDTAHRGAKLKQKRPDFMVLDDIDAEDDTLATVAKKIKRLTHSIIPSGSKDVAILAVQNLVHPDSIFSRMLDGRADFLKGRKVGKPVKMVDNLVYQQRDGKFVFLSGQPTWPSYFPLDAAEREMNDVGLTAFLTEYQHEVEAKPGGMYDHVEFQHVEWSQLPDFVRVVVWVDPAVTDTDESDAHGIQADGIDSNGKIYRLWSWEDRTSPVDSLRRAILKGVELKAESVGVETDQGGDTWESTYKVAADRLVSEGTIKRSQVPRFKSDKAGAGHGSKVHRQQQVLADYERGNVVHAIGTHGILERALKRFPRTKPLDLADAGYWSWSDLKRESPAIITGSVQQPRQQVSSPVPARRI
jgi:hypothetical protein